MRLTNLTLLLLFVSLVLFAQKPRLVMPIDHSQHFKEVFSSGGNLLFMDFRVSLPSSSLYSSVCKSAAPLKDPRTIVADFLRGLNQKFP